MCDSSHFCQQHHPALLARVTVPQTCASTNSEKKKCGGTAVGTVGDHTYNRCATHLTTAERKRLEDSGLLSTAPPVQPNRPAAAAKAASSPTSTPITVDKADHGGVDGLQYQTLRKVPFECVEQLQRKVQDIMHGYDTADAKGKADRAHAVFSLPKISLRVVKERGLGKTIRRLNNTLAQAAPNILVVAVGGTGTGEGDPKIRRARRKAREGYAGRAARMLFADDVESTLTEAQKLDLLRDLHPSIAGSPSTTGTQPINTGRTSVLSIDTEQLRRVAKRACRGAACGRTGWTDELVVQLLDDDATVNALKPLLLDIANDRLDPAVRHRLTACKLSALPKSNNGVRPIAIGEVLLKLTSAYVLETLRDEISAIFRPTQLGVGTPAGCERIIHEIRAELTQTSVLCTIDFRNAFNMPYRSAMKRALEKHPRLAPLYDLFNLAYATPSSLHYSDGTVIDSCRGCRQGDPLGALLFCLVMHDIITEAAAKFPSVKVRAYMDDITLHSADGNAGEVKRCFDFISEHGAAIGMEVRVDKCEWFSAVPPPAGMACKHVDPTTQCIRILGGYLGPDDVVKEKLKAEIVATLPVQFDKTLEMGGQEGLCILRKSLLPKLSFIIRTHAPVLTSECCGFFDAELVKCLESFAQAGIADKRNDIRRLPTKHGGLGFVDVKDIAKHAYEASLESSRVNIATPNDAFIEALSAVPSQQKRTEGFYGGLLLQLTADDDDVYNLLVDAATSGCSAWLQRCSDWDRPLTQEEVSAMLRLRLGAAHAAVAKFTCPGCHTDLPEARYSAHLSGCTRIHASNASAAHAQLKLGVKRLARTCGVAYDDSEPTGFDTVTCPQCRQKLLADNTGGTDYLLDHAATCTATPKATINELLQAHRTRPDIRLYPSEMGGKGLVIDVSLTSNVLQNAQTATRATTLLQVTKREQQKNLLYREKVEASGKDVFLPVVGTAFGAFSPAAQPLFDAFAEEKGRMTGDEVRAACGSIAARARAQSLINAERQAGVPHAVIAATPKPRRQVNTGRSAPTSRLHEAFAQAFAATPAQSTSDASAPPPTTLHTAPTVETPPTASSSVFDGAPSTPDSATATTRPAAVPNRALFNDTPAASPTLPRHSASSAAATRIHPTPMRRPTDVSPTPWPAAPTSQQPPSAPRNATADQHATRTADPIGAFAESLQHTLDETSTPPEATNVDDDPIAQCFTLKIVPNGITSTALGRLQRFKHDVLQRPKSFIAVSALGAEALITVGQGLTAVGFTTITSATYSLLSGPTAWAWMVTYGHTMVMLRFTVATLMLWAHEHTPGSLLARPVGTTSAMQEIRQLCKHAKRVGLNVVVPGTVMLLVVDLAAGTDGATPLVTQERVAAVAAAVPWLLPLAAIRCSYAVVRYSRSLGAWCAASIFGSVATAHCASTALQRTTTIMQSPTELLWMAYGFLTTTSLAGIATAIVATWALALCIERLQPRVAAVRAEHVALGIGYVVKTYPRLCTAVAGTLVAAVVAGTNPPQAATLAISAAILYIAVELHMRGRLADTLLLTGLGLIKLSIVSVTVFVTVVIPFIISKLPQLTYADTASAWDRYQLHTGTASWTDLAMMAVRAVPKIVGTAAEAASVVTCPIRAATGLPMIAA